ncbi:hypothetical protein OG21DRAFT_1515475 [Imleria badia]|nr:hypothetical protein OG21DRAFT_1515475 [Imleria badia]
MKLLQFQADDDSGRLYGPDTFNVPGIQAHTIEMFSLRVESGNTPFVFISAQLDWMDPADLPTLIFDTRSYVFYELPTPGSEPVRWDYTP